MQERISNGGIPNNGLEQDPRISTLADIKRQIRRYLDSSHSDPQTLTSVRRFCERGADLYVAALAETWAARHNADKGVLTASVHAALAQSDAFSRGGNTREDYFTEIDKEGGESVVIAYPPKLNGKIRQLAQMNKFGSIVARAAHINETLPRFEYAWLLALPFKTPRLPYEQKRGRLYGFTNRYWLFRNTAGLSGVPAETNLLCLIFLEQIAKNEAVDTIKDELSRLNPKDNSMQIILPASVEAATQYVVQRLDSVYYHLGYMVKAQGIKSAIAQTHGLTDEQLQVLDDIAFFSQEDLEGGELTQLLTPLMKTVGKGDYQNALLERDFLLDNFATSFPAWRRGDSQAVSHHSVRHLVAHRIANGMPLFENVPPAYQELMMPYAPEFTLRNEAASLRQQENDELLRKEAVASKLMITSIGLVANAQAEQPGNAFDPSREVSGDNSIIITHHSAPISDMNKFSPVHKIRYDKCITDANGKITRIVGHYMAKKGGWSRGELGFAPGELFLNLLYQGLLTPSMVRQAFSMLRNAGQVKEADTIHSLLLERLRKGIAGLEERISKQSYLPKTVETANTKIAIIQQFLSEVEKS